MPKTVRIMGQKITVRQVAHIEQDGMELLGVIDADEGTIHVATHVSRDKAAEVLLHEVLHGALCVAGMSQFPKRTSNEEVVKRLSPVLLDVMRSNPALITYLTEKTR